MGFFTGKGKRRYVPPPPPPPELIETVREVEVTAEVQLDRAQARDEDVNGRHERSKRIQRENALGPRFWQALGEHRGT